MVSFEATLCGMLFVMYVFSSVYAVTERSEMGLYDVPMFMSLWFWNDVCFHVCWMMLLFSDMLVRYASPSDPMCLRCLMLTLSGPVELLFLLCFIATWTCVVVSVMLFECFPIYVSVCFVRFTLTVLMNCLLNVFAIWVGEMNVFSLKVFLLLASPCIVFQRVCVLCL